MSTNAPDEIPSIESIWAVPVWPYAWAARALNMSEKQLDNYRRMEGLPCAKIGKHPFILRDDVLAWMKARSK